MANLKQYAWHKNDPLCFAGFTNTSMENLSFVWCICCGFKLIFVLKFTTETVWFLCSPVWDYANESDTKENKDLTKYAHVTDWRITSTLYSPGLKRNTTWEFSNQKKILNHKKKKKPCTQFKLIWKLAGNFGNLFGLHCMSNEQISFSALYCKKLYLIRQFYRPIILPIPA